MSLWPFSKKVPEDALVWNCKFCRMGVGGNTHKCSVQITNDMLRIVWTSGLMERERVFKPTNLLRANRPDGTVGIITIHVLTTPDTNGDAEYKQYQLSSFALPDGPDSCEAAVNAIAFAHRPLSGRCLIFINPISGTKSGPKRFKSVYHLFHLVGLEFDAVTTKYHGHASEVVASIDLKRYCCIVSVSGDGTLQEIFTALIARPDGDKAIKMPVGCIPAGSEGTLAKISTYFNPMAAVYVILKRHEVRPLDVLEVEQAGMYTYCVCGVGWGIPGKVAEESESLRGMYGRSRYIVSGIKEFVNLKGCKGRLQVLPARERPLCPCGPGCLRCRSGADQASRDAERAARKAIFREEGGAGTPSRSTSERPSAPGEEDLTFEEGICGSCGTGFLRVMAGAAQACPRCGTMYVRGGGAEEGEAFEVGRVARFSLEDLEDDVEQAGAHPQKGEEPPVLATLDGAHAMPQVGVAPNRSLEGDSREGSEEEGSSSRSLGEGGQRGGETKGGQGDSPAALASGGSEGRQQGDSGEEWGEGAGELVEIDLSGRRGRSHDLLPQGDDADSPADPSQPGFTRAASLGGSSEGHRATHSLSPEMLKREGKGVVGIAVSSQLRRVSLGDQKTIVHLDYNKRLAGQGDTADRGAALLQLAKKWQTEEEEALAAAQGQRPFKKKGGGIWQQLDGAFLAVGCLNTEKISAPFVHMSDGCMDIIAVPAIGRMDLLQLGFDMPTGGHLEDRRIFHWKATEMRFTPADESDKFNVDGEVLDGRPIHVRVLPSLARLISAAAEPEPEQPSSYFFNTALGL